MSTPIHQEIQLEASPESVYATLTDAKRFSALSGGAPTEIDATAGGAFSCFGGMIHGRTIELVPAERIVQAWRVKSWSPGVYSIVRMELSKRGDGTTLRLEHSSFPEGQGEHLEKGWHKNYWDPLKQA